MEITAEEQATRDALQAEYDALVAEHEDSPELPDEVDERPGELETAIEALDQRPLAYDADEVARAGVFVSIAPDGSLRIERGFVRPRPRSGHRTACRRGRGWCSAGSIS